MIHLKHRSLLLATAAGVSFSVPSHAQEASDQADNDSSHGRNEVLEEIVVTAQFREQRLQDTPIAITAITGDMLEDRGETYILDIANQAPSVLLEPAVSLGGPMIVSSIRGIGQSDPQPAFEPGVAIYVDDVYQPQVQGVTFDLLDIDRVEVLRGPQGTLSGRNSIGGAIRIYSRPPKGDNSISMSALYGSRDRLELRASADFALTDNLFGRISSVAKEQRGYIQQLDYGCVNPGGPIAPTRPLNDCKVDDLSGVGDQAVRGMLRFVPSPAFEVTLIGDYRRASHTVVGEILVEAVPTNNPNRNIPQLPYTLENYYCGPYCNYATYFNPALTWTSPVPFANGFPVAESRGTNQLKSEGYGLSAHVDIEIAEGLSFKSITAYRDFQATYGSDTDASPAFLVNNLQSSNNHSFSQEVRLSWEISDTLDFTAGAFYFDQFTQNPTQLDVRTAVVPVIWVSHDKISADSKAAFGHVNWEPLDNFTLSGGIRYSEEAKTYEFIRSEFDGSPSVWSGFLDGLSNTYEGNIFDYRVSADYRFSDALMVYGSASTGTKGGGISPRPFIPEQLLPFGPEELTAYEVGVKSDLWDHRLRLNVAAYRNKYSGIQLRLETCPQFDPPPPARPAAGCALTANAGDGVIKGIEGELTFVPIDGLTFDASASVLDFEYTFINPAAGGPTNPQGPQFDDPLIYTPDWKWHIGGQYEIDLGRAGTLTPRLDVAAQGKIFISHDPVTTPGVPGDRVFLDGRTLLDLRASWSNEAKDLEVMLEWTNVTDEYYLQNGLDLRDGNFFFTGVPGRPREWAVRVSKRF